MSCTLTGACCLLPCCCKRMHVSQRLWLSLQGECPHDARLFLHIVHSEMSLLQYLWGRKFELHWASKVRDTG